jgi:transcriptional regulator with XRE-family HTH domain
MPRARYAANKQFYIALGRRIAQVRQPRMTQDDLAKAVALSRTSVINIEKGRQQVLVHTLASISQALGVSPDKLLPPADDLDVSLRDTPKSGREWIMNAVVTTKKE